MSKILVCLSNDLFIDGEYRPVCFYEQLLSSLVDNGNDVLVFIPDPFNLHYFDPNRANQLRPDVDEDKLVHDITSFSPELVIAFNNITYHRILEITDCPIVVWDADMEALWHQCDTIKQNLERYIYFSFSTHYIARLQPFFGFKDHQCHEVRGATSLTNTAVSPTVNISFIGTNFAQPRMLRNFIHRHTGKPTLHEIFKLIKENPLRSEDDLLSALSSEADAEVVADFRNFNEDIYSHFFSGEMRIETLLHMADLGLDLYGSDNWQHLTLLPTLLGSYRNKSVYSAQHNEEIYNTSKLCLNIQHNQGITGMSWRVLDILATGGCLVSDETPFMKNLFHGRINIPFYHTPCQAKALCEELLHDESRRLEIVAASNAFIEDGWRWDQRIEQMQDILSMPLAKQGEPGTLATLQPKRIKGVKLAKPDRLSAKLKFKNRIRLKLYTHLEKKLTRKGLI